MDIGTRTGLEVTAVGLGIGLLINKAHNDGMAAMAQARADREQAAWEDRIVGIAQAAVADLATANREIAKLKAEVARLQTMQRLSDAAARLRRSKA